MAREASQIAGSRVVYAALGLAGTDLETAPSRSTRRDTPRVGSSPNRQYTCRRLAFRRYSTRVQPLWPKWQLVCNTRTEGRRAITTQR